MALAEDLIFNDPALLRVFFDSRLFAPRWRADADINLLEARITDDKLAFLKSKSLPASEILQKRIRRHWFAARDLADGYFIRWPCDYSDGCQHVSPFQKTKKDFQVDANKRVAIWRRYERQKPPRYLEMGLTN